jgi:hypothetical protein
VGEHGVGHAEGRSADGSGAPLVIDPTAQAVTCVTGLVPLVPEGLVVAQRAPRDGETRPKQIRQAASQAVGAVAGGAAAAADRLVVSDRAVDERHHGPHITRQPPADAVACEAPPVLPSPPTARLC